MTIKQKESAVSALAVTIWRDSSWSKRSTVCNNELRKEQTSMIRGYLFYAKAIFEHS